MLAAEHDDSDLVCDSLRYVEPLQLGVQQPWQAPVELVGTGKDMPTCKARLFYCKGASLARMPFPSWTTHTADSRNQTQVHWWKSAALNTQPRLRLSFSFKIWRRQTAQNKYWLDSNCASPTLSQSTCCGQLQRTQHKPTHFLVLQLDPRPFRF